MPIYEFYNAEMDQRVMVQRKVEDRDKPLEFHRITVPSTISIHGFEPSEAETFDNQILRKLYQKEEKEGSRFACGEFTKKQIKDAWTDPVREVATPEVNGNGE